jgi:hypothetical protein
LKGPILRRKRQLDWRRDELGQISPQSVEKVVPCYERVDPFRLYPEPGISDIEDGYIFEHHRLSRTDLAMLKGLPGYDDAAISEILDTATTGSLSGWLETTEFTRADLEKRYSSWTRPTLLIDALEFWGHVSGKMLMDWGGLPEDVTDPDAEYPINAWMVDRWLIKVVVNPDPLARKPYYKTSFFKIPGAFWGRGIPEVMKDTQQMVNAAARALSNNMGIASGPQVMVNLDRLPPGESITSLVPWKIWQVTSDPIGNSANKAIEFDHPDSHAQELMGIIQNFSKLADDHTGIPAYVYGDTDVSGAGRTASGLSMLMGSAGKGLRQVVMYIDNDIVRPMIERQYHFNMRYDDDDSIKGDCEVVPRGAVNLAVKEQLNVRRIEFLNATANPIDMQIVGLPGRAAILRELAKELNMPADEIVPDIEQIKQQQMMMAMQGQQPGAPEAEPGAPKEKPPENRNPPGDTQQTFADGGQVGEEVKFVKDENGSIIGARFGVTPVKIVATQVDKPDMSGVEGKISELSELSKRALAMQMTGKTFVTGPDGKISGVKVGDLGVMPVRRDASGRPIGLDPIQ